MRRLIFRGMLALCLAGLTLTPVLAAHEISLALWNLEKLQEGGFLGEQLRAKLRKDAKVLKALDADILGLSEAASPAMLHKLLNRKLDRLSYTHLLTGGPDAPEGIDVALVSRLPFEPILLEKPEGSLGLALGRFESTGGVFYVMVTHWAEEASPEQRLALAERILEIAFTQIPARELGEEVPLVILGDLEITPHDPAFEKLLAGGLIDTMAETVPDLRWSHAVVESGKPHLLAFDHVLITSALEQGENLHFVATSSRVRRLDFMQKKRRVGSERILFPLDDQGRDMGFSDHFPVMTRLWVRD